MSSGVARIELTVGGVILSFTVYILRADIPIHLSLDDTDRMGVYFNNTTNKLVHVASGIRKQSLELMDISF